MHSSNRDHVGSVLSALISEMPDLEVQSVTRLGEGMVNVAFEVNGRLIVRFSKESNPAKRAALVNHEARLLETVAGISTLPVPEPEFTVPHQGCLAYFKLPGTPLLDIPHEQRSAYAPSIGSALGELLAALHSVPVGRMADLVDADAQPLDGWRADAAGLVESLGDGIPEARRPAIASFLAAPPPPEPSSLVFSHNDLGIEHVLVDPADGSVSGIIDWGDAAITDPAYDFGLLYRDLGPAALQAALESYRQDADLARIRGRAEFYGRCSVFEDLAYGIEIDDRRYVDKALAAFAWLFDAGGTPGGRI
jgi:aminoglycoside phosphotransferase (APT) family kinase protein